MSSVQCLKSPKDIRLDRPQLAIHAANGAGKRPFHALVADQARQSLPDPDVGSDAMPVVIAGLADVISAAGTTLIRDIHDVGDPGVHRCKMRVMGVQIPGTLFPYCSTSSGHARLRTSAACRDTNISSASAKIRTILIAKSGRHG